MSSDDITQRAISHSLTLNNFGGKTTPACPPFRDVREMVGLIDLALCWGQASWPLERRTCHWAGLSQSPSPRRVMMWTMDRSQGANPLQGTNAPLTIQVKVTFTLCKGHLTTRTHGVSCLSAQQLPQLYSYMHVLAHIIIKLFLKVGLANDALVKRKASNQKCSHI